MREQPSGNGLLHADDANGAQGELAVADTSACGIVAWTCSLPWIGPPLELNMMVVVSEWWVEPGASGSDHLGSHAVMRGSLRCLGSR